MFSMVPKTADKAMKSVERLAVEPHVPGGTLFEAMICELHWMALQVGGIACIMNACVERKQIVVPGSCQNLLPFDSPVMFAAIKSWDDFGVAKQLCTRLEKVCRELECAKVTTKNMMLAPHTVGGKVAPLMAIAQLAAVWRALATDLAALVSLLEPEVRWRVGGRYSENSIVLAQLLKEAVVGKSSCVDPNFEVALPVLPQRRRAARFALQQNCRIAVRGRIVGAFANDVSIYGIGLTCQFPFKLKEPILIELQSGRRFKGLVAWTKDDKLGVQFDTGLNRDDPLIKG